MMNPSVNAFAILIPAYNPTQTLCSLVEDLTARGHHVVVVDDGSERQYASLFNQLESRPQVVILRHAVNLGKGAALKTGLNYIAVHYTSAKGVVCADADGQHLTEDILKVGRRIPDDSGALVLGVRSLSSDAPLRSRVGNALTRRIFNFLMGLRLADTQTGLRGISRCLICDYLDLRANRYEYELEQLVRAKQNGHRILQVPISSIYIDENAGSHFNPLLDSMRIYFVLFRYMLSSMFAAGLDYLIFMVTVSMTGNILASQYIARALAGGFNYAVNRERVFFSSAPVFSSLPKYVLLAATLAYCAYLLIIFFKYAGIPVVVAKPMAESLLFVVSFGMQRSFVFARWKGDNPSDVF